MQSALMFFHRTAFKKETSALNPGVQSMLGMRKLWCDLAVAGIFFSSLLVVPGLSLHAANEPGESDTSQQVAEVCTGESLGTIVTWYKDPKFAAQLAREQNKLLYVIQVSGNFALEEFT